MTPSPAAIAPLRPAYRQPPGQLSPAAPATAALPARATDGDADGLLRGVAFGLAFVAPFWGLVALVAVQVF